MPFLCQRIAVGFPLVTLFMCQPTCHNDGCADFSRMIESYLCARDRFLKPGGKMFPNAGTLCPLAVNRGRRGMFWREVWSGVGCANLDRTMNSYKPLLEIAWTVFGRHWLCTKGSLLNPPMEFLRSSSKFPFVSSIKKMIRWMRLNWLIQSENLCKSHLEVSRLSPIPCFIGSRQTSILPAPERSGSGS